MICLPLWDICTQAIGRVMANGYTSITRKAWWVVYFIWIEDSFIGLIGIVQQLEYLIFPELVRKAYHDLYALILNRTSESLIILISIGETF